MGDECLISRLRILNIFCSMNKPLKTTVYAFQGLVMQQPVLGAHVKKKSPEFLWE